MVDQSTDFFQITDNLKEHATTPSILISASSLDFVPKVSIVIPTYKRTDLLKEALDSAINQVGFEQYDIIVAHDDPERGCATEQLISTYSNKRISYYKNAATLTMVGNMNRCFELTKADWVVMLHDDDLLLPDFISECMKFIEQHPDTGILKPGQYELHNNEPLPEFTASEKVNRVYDVDHCLGNVVASPSGVLFNKQKVLSIGGFNPKFYPQFDFVFMVLFSYYYKVYKMQRVLSVYRWIRNESLLIGTLKGFITHDFYLYGYLYKRFKVPSKLSSNILSMKFTGIEKEYKKINADFSFDVATLGVKPINAGTSRLSYYLLRLIVLFYRGMYFLGGNSIFKKRRERLKQKPEINRDEVLNSLLLLAVCFN
jgi:glycosyltransferase